MITTRTATLIALLLTLIPSLSLFSSQTTEHDSQIDINQYFPKLLSLFNHSYYGTTIIQRFIKASIGIFEDDEHYFNGLSNQLSPKDIKHNAKLLLQGQFPAQIMLRKRINSIMQYHIFRSKLESNRLTITYTINNISEEEIPIIPSSDPLLEGITKKYENGACSFTMTICAPLDY